MNKLTQQCLQSLSQSSTMGKSLPKFKSSLIRTMFRSSPQMSYLLKHHIHTANEPLPATYKVLRSHGYGKEPVFDEIPLPKPGKNQVLIKMAYAPLNPTDMDAMSGIYSSVLNPPYTCGSEGSGVIVAVGEDLKVPHKVGDKVHAIGTGARGEFYKGTIGQYYLNDAETCSPIQEGLTMQEAASHWVNPGTAYYMYLHAVKGNHKAAIHTSGSSALGKMLIKLFKHKGIKLINIVRNDKYIEELKKEGADYVLNSQHPDFEKNLREIAAKEQATIGFDAVCGPLTTKLINCMPRGSTAHVYGMLSGEVEVKVSYFDLVLGKSLKGLLQTNFLAESYAEGKLGEVLNDVHSLLPTVLKTPIQKEVDLREYNIKDLKDAVEFHHKNNAKGRVVLRLN